jgi:hypothetical protein
MWKSNHARTWGEQPVSPLGGFLLCQSHFENRREGEINKFSAKGAWIQAELGTARLNAAQDPPQCRCLTLISSTK